MECKEIKKEDLFKLRPKLHPQIYVYSVNEIYPGCLKIGYTTKENIEDRIKQQFNIEFPKNKKPYKIKYFTDAIKDDGQAFTDKDIHRILKKMGKECLGGEWYKCSVDDVKAAIVTVSKGIENIESRTQTFKMRPEQEAAVEKTFAYFQSCLHSNREKPPHFLWNAKMRFGKTFATYQLALKMGWTKVLILTYKPAVESAWKEDLLSHIDFEGWQFIAKDALNYEDIDRHKPFVCFGSFQDYLGKSKDHKIKAKNEWVHAINWDCVVFDEYHYGAWRESAKELFDSDFDMKYELGDFDFNEDFIPITTKAYLYLSGTPFRAISNGEFIEEQIFNWTYSDEQKAKESYTGDNNPYASLPKMILMTYKLPDYIRDIALKGEFNEFDLNTFFKAVGDGDNAHFIYVDEVQKWLDLIRGAASESEIDNLKLGQKKPPLPFEDTRLLNILSHTVWFLPSVSSCYAMKNLLSQKQNKFYHDYDIVVAAGKKAGVGVKAIEPVKKAIGNPMKTKTITLSCGKLMTGVTIGPWSGIFMLRNLKTPETYFQAAFRVQSPWTIDSDGYDNKKIIVKENCYVFDFAPDRALSQIAEYSCRLNLHETNPKEKVEEFIKFLPVLAYNGVAMEEVDASGLLDIAMSGTTATLLARRWESALLVNVDNEILNTVLNNDEALNAIMKIEGFRNLNNDIEVIINKSNAIKEKKKDSFNKELSPTEKKELSDEEREIKNKRKAIQKKLIKFATRIPIFMYLTDEREETLMDIIRRIDFGLFKKVTGLSLADFELLVDLGLFNGPLMNQAVYNFKRYEDSSIVYTGIDKHSDEDVGLFDTVLSREDYEHLPM